MTRGGGGTPGEGRPAPSPRPVRPPDPAYPAETRQLAQPAANVATADRPAPWYHWQPPDPSQRREYPPPPKTIGDHFGEKASAVMPSFLRNTLDATGQLYTMFGASLYGLFADIFSRKFKFNEFVERSWFLISVTILPAMLVSIPLGVSIALQVGALAAQIGATSFVGAADAIGVLREAAPIVTALLLAGVGGSAVCAELGARTIREEIDAMIVLGLNPLRRLVAPLMVAGVLVSGLLCFAIIFVSVLSAYVFDLAALHGTKGSFFGSFTQFANMSDFVASELKAMVFGLVAVMIAAYLGLNAKRGPTGVGEAVNQSVVITGIVLFGLNLVITEIFFAVVPQRTF